MNISNLLDSIFTKDFHLENNFIQNTDVSKSENQKQTNEIFSYKWKSMDYTKETKNSFEFQKKWYLSLYGFKNETVLSDYLKEKKIILDAGCGLGYKAAWFAELAPESLVVAVDFSSAVLQGAQYYSKLKNLVFMQDDIGKLPFKENSIDYISCDQVIMHTEDPDYTFADLSRILKRKSEFACYVYAKKALPRELIDDYFRTQCKNMSSDELMDMSKSLTELGKRLTELNIKIDVPDIPQLQIKGGEYDLQRFIYWNFLKCFWNADLGKEVSDATNFDWYSPSNAKRYREEEFKTLIKNNNLEIQYFHKEEACYSGRFLKA